MKIEPNLLGACVSAAALAMLVASAGVFGGGDAALRYAAVALGVMAAAMLLNRVLLTVRRRRSRPLVSSDRPGLGVVLIGFPLVVMASAALPALAPGGDFTFMVAIAAVWMAVTLQSALVAWRIARQG